MRGILVLLMLGLLMFSGTAYGQGAPSLQADMASIIRARPEINSARQKRLIAAAKEVLDAHPVSDADKTTHFKAEFQQYLDDVLAAAPQFSDSQFQVIVDRVSWNVLNFAQLTPIDDARRGRVAQCLDACHQGTSQFIDATYLDTPPEVRKDLAARCDSVLAGITKHWGSYFYPETLYVSEQPVSAGFVKDALTKAPMMAGNGSKFAPVARLLNDKTIPAGSSQVHVGFFLNDQSSIITSALGQALASTFQPSDQDTHYVMPSESLMVGYKTLSAALSTTKPSEAEVESRRNLIAQTLANTNVSVDQGLVVGGGENAGNDVMNVVNPTPSVTAPVPMAIASSPGDGNGWSVLQVGLITAGVAALGLTAIGLLVRKRAARRLRT